MAAMIMIPVTLAAMLLGIPIAAVAGPADYVFLPGVTYGEREIDLKMGSWKHPTDGNLSAASIGFGYGVTQRWFTEVYRKYEHPGGARHAVRCMGVGEQVSADRGRAVSGRYR